MHAIATTASSTCRISVQGLTQLGPGISKPSGSCYENMRRLTRGAEQTGNASLDWTWKSSAYVGCDAPDVPSIAIGPARGSVGICLQGLSSKKRRGDVDTPPAVGIAHPARKKAPTWNLRRVAFSAKE